MVRADVVNHPNEWMNSGYNEIQNPRQRYNLIDLKRLTILFGLDSLEELQKLQKSWIEEALNNERLERDSKWSESIAVGRKSFRSGRAIIACPALGQLPQTGLRSVAEVRRMAHYSTCIRMCP